MLPVIKDDQVQETEREARHRRYHEAVLRGRNPKSFQKKDPLWTSVYVHTRVC